MGRKEKWFKAVKKALSSGAKDKKDQKLGKPKKKWFKDKNRAETSSASAEAGASSPASIPPEATPPIIPPAAVRIGNDQQAKHAYTVAVATAKAAEAAAAAAQAAAEVARLATVTCPVVKPDDKLAAIRIQAAFRGYLARRQLKALKGLARLKTLMQRQSVKHQTTNTLKLMETLTRVQSQVRARRLRMSEENQARMRHLLHKHAKENEKLEIGEHWDYSLKSKEQIEEHLHNRQEAAGRRERAMAYAFSHQQTWRKTSGSANITFMDPNTPHWGWCWLERWLAARPWETASNPEKQDPKNPSHNNSEKPSRPAVSRRQTRLTDRLSTSSPPSKVSSPKSVTAKLKSRSSTERPRASLTGPDDDMKSVTSVNSDTHCQRHSSVAGSSIRDDDSLTNSHPTSPVPSYMATTQSAKAKSRLGTPDRLSVSSVKKRASHPTSPARSRHSVSSMNDATSIA